MSEISVFDVANAFLFFAPMTQKKLQKLCYYTQAWNLALYDEPLFNQDFQAWIHGPVCPDLYNRYKDYGWNEIEKQDSMPTVIVVDDNKYELISEIFRIYGGLTGDQLELLTHSEKPWQEARSGLKEWEPSNAIISSTSMREFYLDEFRRSQND